MHLEYYTEAELAQRTDQELNQTEQSAEHSMTEYMQGIDQHSTAALQLLDLLSEDSETEYLEMARKELQSIRDNLKCYDECCAVLSDIHEERERRATLPNG